MSQWITGLTAQHRTFARKLARRHRQAMRAEDPAHALPSWAGTRLDAILQPPRPQFQPFARVLERITQRNLDMEAIE